MAGGESTSAIITGSSMHNERIERLWRDVNRCMSSLFRDVFYTLEFEDAIDPINATDLYCLHYVFLPRINASLQPLILLTLGTIIPFLLNKSLIQTSCLYIRGALEQNMILEAPQRHHQHVRKKQIPTTTNHVKVPRIVFTPCTSLQHILTTHVNPLGHLHHFELDTCHHTINILGRHLLGVCNDCRC